jgi:ubiquinone/menaquinone biosynthesis C-methylase UbiE
MSASIVQPTRMDEKAYAEFGERHFGSVSLSKLARIREDAGASILDVGCGPGLYLKALGNLGFDVTGIDSNSLFVNEALKHSKSAWRVDFENEGLSRLADRSFDTVLMLDILEHVHNDVELLKEGMRVCRRNVIVTVPVQMSDAFNGSQLIFGSCVDPTHLRYYSNEELRQLFINAGIENYRIEVGLRFDPVLYNVFPKLLRYPLSLINRALLKVSDPKLFATVWYAIGWK